MHGTVSEEPEKFCDVERINSSLDTEQGREFEEKRRRKNDIWRRCDVTTSETPER